MFPAVLALVALYALFDRLGQYIPFLGLNTHGGLIFSYLGGIALHVWTIKGYFETIDGSLGRSGCVGWCNTMAGIPSGIAATLCANPCGSIYPVVHRGSNRSTCSVTATD